MATSLFIVQKMYFWIHRKYDASGVQPIVLAVVVGGKLVRYRSWLYSLGFSFVFSIVIVISDNCVHSTYSSLSHCIYNAHLFSRREGVLFLSSSPYWPDTLLDFE